MTDLVISFLALEEVIENVHTALESVERLLEEVHYSREFVSDLHRIQNKITDCCIFLNGVYEREQQKNKIMYLQL